jgi:penicillin-insensitive murein DD-endopeptidase
MWLLVTTLATLVAGPTDAGAAVVAEVPQAPPKDMRWSQPVPPRSGLPLSIGAYANGCLQGAKALPPSGPGYELLHLGRRRGFGHPALLQYIRHLAADVRKKKLGLVFVGDLSQARGGPTPNGHKSHQTGLDVDVGFAVPAWALKRRITAAERESIQPPPVVDLVSHTLTSYWAPRVPRLLELAASDPEVDRIFVNPIVKREVCAVAKGAPWVRKLRPWWGHHDHFHVRLRCPSGSEECQQQDPLPADDGCGPSLKWWFTEDARTTHQRRAEPAAPPPLPAHCESLWP